MPDFAVWTPEDWTALATVVTAVVAVVAAAFAFLQVRHARLLREEQAQPFVVVDFQSAATWINVIELVIENIGRTVATDVQVKFDPPLEASKGSNTTYDIAKSVLLTKGIPTMPPGRRIAARFDLSHERVGSGLPMTYTATVTCKDARGRKQDDLTYVLDLNFLYGYSPSVAYGVHDGVQALREIRDSVKKWTTHPDGLRVYAVDADARRFDERWQVEHSGGYPPTLGDPTPAGRRTPSRFDRYKEPLWKQALWGLRLAEQRRNRRREVLAQMETRPDLAPTLARKLEGLEGRRWVNRLRAILRGEAGEP